MRVLKREPNDAAVIRIALAWYQVLGEPVEGAASPFAVAVARLGACEVTCSPTVATGLGASVQHQVARSNEAGAGLVCAIDGHVDESSRRRTEVMPNPEAG